ncbi:MAG: arginine--tRNA ligase [Patescibacteria group bacterium]|nr:arginine--tRNA ligase [Patescibacteria group bacterium]
MKEKIEKLIEDALEELNLKVKNFLVEYPADISNGDFSTNVAMVSKTDPEKIKEKIKKIDEIEKIEVKNGFINFFLSKKFLVDSIKNINENWGSNCSRKREKIMVEYTQPNPFKPFHIGHLMSNAIGESISRLIEFSGAKVIRANYQGDVGPHVAKAIYELRKNHAKELEEEGDVIFKSQFIGQCYVKGNEAYENDEETKKQIDQINKEIYDRSNPEINKINDWGLEITLSAFERIYDILGTEFDKYYFESDMAEVGKKIVSKNKIFKKSENALIFEAGKYNPKLHTRVFITSQGLPTYETKELGLIVTKFKKSLFSKKLDLSIVTTGKEQEEYMKVVEEAISQIYPQYRSRMKHIPHGLMRLKTGKISSRTGNIITGESLLRDSMAVVREKIADRKLNNKDEIAKLVGVGALKHSILKSSISSDIIFDFEKSISFEGDSGPYLQYTTVRAKAILNKSGKHLGNEISEEVNYLERILYRFPDIVKRSQDEFEPHYVTNYLTELASTFNSFYNRTHLLKKDNYLNYRLDLVKAFYLTMKNGLYLLGISVPEKM